MSTVTKSSPADCAVNIFPPIHMVGSRSFSSFIHFPLLRTNLRGFSISTPYTFFGLRYVLHKELKNSDVTSLGRIVLPKITVRDMFSPDAWRMRYRFWPNNKSRMYVLENTGDYIKKNGLSCGDVVALYQDEYKQLKYILSRSLMCISFEIITMNNRHKQSS
ncbi:unnamed protein product [Spirodela intermedia]|uniref:TF-B3 domain-containing protein n=1 Tax=Spirodela intermedia TaxID=51605 RepID=A0A7I8IJY3_SPIIN|nr:unnamed protein product [Spirodela intermedia]CAA6658191.1 unnamed protein product [Spirodela intermedia]